MYRTWRPGGAGEATQVLAGGGLYQTGERFSLAGWSADEWAKFFESAGGAVSQVYGTVTSRPIAQPPVPVTATPIGGVPTWAIVGLIAVGGFFLLSRKR